MKTQAISNTWTIFLNFVVLCIAVTILTACGGGGGSSPSSGGSTNGLSSGEVEGFGSVIVNGVKFEVEGAEIEFEHGQTFIVNGGNEQTVLREGMQVELEGSFDDNGRTGTATRLVVDDELEGPISSLDTSNLATTRVVTFTVLGQNVIAIDGVTNVDDSVLNGQLSNLLDGMYVEVHGLPDDDGNLRASFIEWKAANQTDFNNLPNNEGELEVTGVITANNPGSSQFNIGSQLVDYTGVTPDGTLDVGVLVEVKGTLNGVTLEATIVHVEDGPGDDVAKVEVEGYIRDLNTPVDGQFTLNGQVVDYGRARYFNGVENDLALGIKVEAEGPVTGGVMFATKIKFKDSFRYEGAVTPSGSNVIINVPSGGSLLVLIDTTVADVEPGIDYNTRNVKIRARIADGSTLVATRIDDDGNRDTTRQIFRGPVVDIDVANEVVELIDDGTSSTPPVGLIEFDTTALLDLNQQGGTDSDFEIDNGSANQNVTRAAFYNTLQVGDHVKIRYNGVLEDQIELELED